MTRSRRHRLRFTSPLIAIAVLLLAAGLALGGGGGTTTVEAGTYFDYVAPDPLGPTDGSITLRVQRCPRGDRRGRRARSAGGHEPGVPREWEPDLPRGDPRGWRHHPPRVRRGVHRERDGDPGRRHLRPRRRRLRHRRSPRRSGRIRRGQSHVRCHDRSSGRHRRDPRRRLPDRPDRRPVDDVRRADLGDGSGQPTWAAATSASGERRYPAR